MADQVIGVTIKGIGDFSDVVSNVGSVQKALTKLKLPDKLGDSLNKNISNFMKEYDKYQKKIAEGIHTQGDQNAVNKSLNSMLNSYEKIIKDFGKISSKDFKDIFNLDEGQFASVQKRIKDIEANIKKIKLDPKQLTEPLKVFQDATKAKSLFGSGKGFDRLDQAFKNNNLEEAKQAIIEIDNYLTRFGSRMDPTKLERLNSIFAPLKQHVLDSDNAAKVFTSDVDKLNNELSEIGGRGAQELNQLQNGLKGTDNAAKSVVAELKQLHASEFDFNRQAADIDRQIQSYFGLSQMIRKVGDIARDAFATVKELDAAMTETAVVTNFSVGDMWDMLPTYTQQANQLGSTIKDVYEAATLYYQQGLNTNQAMGLANETLKMARIAGLGAAEATDMMTAALRGFNMEINQQSAQKINDIYSELAAITASDTAEIGSAMERTASIANSANMEFATTSAFLAQMIETTREAPENLGTAMKTIVARFQEMKKDPTKLIDSEGVAMDANKVDTALKSIGVQLMNTKGEFRDLDDVFLDIASKWDTLSQGQQRYIATIAAGSRQQSRFIAMMSNYERTMELVDAANNSAGASQRQFEKTLDSMEAKLNKLKNAWDQFTMGLMNNQILKFGVDALTEGFTVVNKFIDILGKLPPKPFEGITKSVLTLVTTLGMLNFGKKASRGLIMGGAGWWKGEASLTGGFSQGWKDASRSSFFGKGSNAKQQGLKDGAEYSRGFNQGALKINLKANGLIDTMKSAYTQIGKKAIGWDTIQSNKMAVSSPVSQIVDQLLPEDAITAEATNQLQKAIDEAGGNVRLGVSNYKRKTGKGKFFTNKEAENLQQQYDEIQSKAKTGDELEESANKAEKFGASIANAGQSLQIFGTYLENTPLAPFGSLLSSVGSLLMSFGSTIGWVGTTWAASVEAAGGATLSATAMMKAGITGVTEALMASPVFWIAAAVLAVVAAVKIADAAIETQAEKLEKAEDAAAAASEAYDSAKQETSELADSISKIQETDSAFDGLVAGTADFNEQLVTANEQIMALIDKYPMLLDASKNYVTTDNNGLMHISEAGFKAVKEYQKQIQANASAMNLIQTADLNALEHQQEADALRKKINGSRRGEMTEAEAKEHEKNLREADMLDQRAEAEVRLARSNAIRTALAGKELRDVDSLTSVYTNLYDTKRKAAEVQVNGMDKHGIRQQYADYHGYTYDRTTKKITDVEGNEVDYDDKVIRDEVIEQTVLLDFEANASTLEGVLNQVDAKFASTLKSTSENSAHFISDVLANNINTDEDILEQALSGNDFQDAVNSMTEKEMAAILGINAESINEQNIDAKRDEIVDLLMNNATKIAEAQSKSYEELATMMAQSKGWDTFDAEQKASQDIIRKEIQNLTAEQAHMMSDIGSQLKEGAGMEAMQIYINRMSDLYKNINESGKQSDKDAAKEIEDIFNSVDLTGATGRLEAYTKMADSTSDTVRKLGEDMRASVGEANLLGQTFDEFLGGDWLELAENADDFKNSLGQIDTAGILKASEQSHTLKTMLDSGEVSASGLAMALQGVEDGKYSIGAVNDSVLQLLSSLNRIEDEAMKAHNLISNFDAGIDYGEASDFAKQNAEKAQEYWDNGEFGNQQLQNYIKLAAGQDRWNEAIKASGGDLEKAEKGLLKYVTTFKDGFQPVIDQLVNGQGIDGDSLSKNIDQALKSNKIDETLANKFKEITPRIEGDNFLFSKLGETATELTTNELKTYLEQIYGVSTEYAELILEEWANLSPDLAAELSKNDLLAAIGTDTFKAAHGTTESGQTILTDQEISILEQAGGTEALEKAAIDLGYVTTEQKSAAEAMKEASFKVLDENGNRIDNTNDPTLLQNYIKTFDKAEKGSIESLFKTGAEELFTQGRLDLSKLIQDTQAHGFDQAQAMQAAWQAYQRGEQLGERTSYEGVELDKGIATYEEFTASIESALEASKWQSIGESIAQGIINFINSQDPGKQETDKAYEQNKQEAKNQADANASREATLKAYEDVNKIFGKIGEWLTTPVDANAARNQKMYGGTEASTDISKTESSEKLNAAGDTLTTAASQFATGAESLSSAGESLNTAGSNLTSAAAAIATANQSHTPGQSIPGAPSNNSSTQSSISGAIVVDNSAALKSLDEVKAKAEETKSTIQQGATFKVKVNDTGLKKAANRAETISKSSGTKSINVSAKGADETNTLTTAVKDFNKLNNKTIKLGVSVSGLSSVNSAISAVRSFYNLRDDKVTLTTVKETITKGKAKGQYNHGYAAPPSFGSAARGRYGQVGPKGKGGLTLTGELGYEIAWLPDENRSMILGANGPQMINLPGNAVVWNHEQSEEILKQKAIPAGSHFRIPQSGGGGGSNTSTAKAVKDAAKHVKKKANEAAAAVQKVSVWWENIARKTEVAQRSQDKSQKAFEKYLKEMRATLRTTGQSLSVGGGGGDDYLTNIGKTLGYYEAQLEKVNKELNNLTNGTAPKEQKKRKEKYGEEGYENIAKISYKSGKKSKEELVDLAKYIKEEDGTFVVDQAELDKVKSKDQRKAIADAANKEINDRLSKKYKAEDEIEKAQEAITKFGEELYNTFFKWEVELTKIWNITQKIEQTEARISQFKGYSDLLESQLSTGMAKAGSDFAKQSLSAFKAGLEQQTKQISLSFDALGQKKTDLNKLIDLEDEKETLLKIQDKLVNNIGEQNNVAKLQEELASKQEALNQATSKRESLEKREDTIDSDIASTNKKTKSKKKKTRNAAKKKLKTLNKEKDSLPTELANARATEAAATADYEAAKKAYESAKNDVALNDTERIGYEEYAKQLEDNIAMQAEAWKYMTVNQLSDGSLDVNFNTEAFEAEKFAGNISEERGKQIQDYVKSIVDGSKELSQQYTDTTSLINDMYGSLQTLQDAWANYADELWDISEAEQRKEVDNTKKLSDSLTNSLKDLLDEVKRKLDERRKQEDNAKTERDISQKQQRLAALRADTSGGHQVEIAQLQQEIADAQQSYQRSLEDQLLDRLQQQADLAAQQREQQIALQEATISAVNNAALVNQWMNDPVTYKDAILEAFKTANDYDKKPEALQQQLDNKFETLFNGLLTNQEEQALVTENISLLEGKTEEIRAELEQFTALKGAIDQLTSTLSQLSGSNTAQEVNKPTGLTAEQTTAGRIEAAQKAANASTTSTESTVAEDPAKKAYEEAIAAAHKKKSIDKDTFADAVRKGKAIGYDEAHVAKDLAEGDGKGGVTWEEVVKAAKKAGYKKDKIAKWSTDKYLAKAIKKWKQYKYETGGLANYTGPAWLDGTPSKPELVLNSTDTKNFLALRDVLSSAMSSIDTTSNSYGGDTMYEININVDHLNNDYDVDKVVEKVKKEITKGAGYRNVTQVRNFR